MAWLAYLQTRWGSVKSTFLHMLYLPILGKTVQALTAVVSSRILSLRNRTTGAVLVICPASVLIHWESEITKFFKPTILRPLLFADLLSRSIKSSSSVIEEDSRNSILRGLSIHDVVLVSYAKFLKEIHILKEVLWDTIILDEAHIIKNPKSKTAEAIFSVRAQRRIAITGTPLQNNVNELWSIFNFLLPDYLGEYNEFRSEYIAPIQRSFEIIESNRGGSSNRQSISLQGLTKLQQLHKMVTNLSFLSIVSNCI